LCRDEENDSFLRELEDLGDGEREVELEDEYDDEVDEDDDTDLGRPRRRR
jgi:hypothetical protein